MARHAIAAAALALLAAAAGAQEQRPSEEELFGAPPREQAPRPPAAAAEPPPPAPQASVSKEKEDPLKVGGMLYLRGWLFAAEDQAPADWRVSSPNLLDVFLDVRPNDRVRGFVLGRLAYDPTLDSGASAVVGLTPAAAQALGLTVQNPKGNLDQLWVNFDVGRTLFVTAGKQHVKWGVGRLWNPTDFLHREPRNPLDPFDARTGVTLVKAHLPWEKRGWNLYGVALLEDPRSGAGSAAGTVGGIPAGGRAEIVLGTVELGLDALAGKGARPRWGADVSGGVGDFDLHAEVALGAARARWRDTQPGSPDLTAPGRFVLERPSGPSPQVVAGGSWVYQYSDEDAVTIDAEYFFQEAGYGDTRLYPFLLFGAPRLLPGPTLAVAQQDPGAFTAFHLGKHYAGASVELPFPGSWNDTTFVLSAIANLTDRSGIVRLDHSVLALTYLRVETFVQGHLGRSGGEFRLGFDVPQVSVAVKRPRVDAGVALRVSL